MEKLPEGTRLPNAKEYAMLKRTQQYSGVYQHLDSEGNVELLYFDKDNPITE